jgi:chromosome segregation ATPase
MDSNIRMSGMAFGQAHKWTIAQSKAEATIYGKQRGILRRIVDSNARLLSMGYNKLHEESKYSKARLQLKVSNILKSLTDRDTSFKIMAYNGLRQHATSINGTISGNSFQKKQQLLKRLTDMGHNLQVMALNSLKRFLAFERSRQNKFILEDSISDLQQQLAHKQHEAYELSRELDLTHASLNSTTENLQEKSNSLKNALEEIEKLTYELEDRQNELNLRIDEVQRLTKTNSELRKEYSDLREIERGKEKENIDLKTDCYNLDLSVTQGEYEINRLKTMLDETTRDNTMLSGDLMGTSEKLKDAMWELYNKEEKLKTQGADIIHLENNYNLVCTAKSE